MICFWLQPSCEKRPGSLTIEQRALLQPPLAGDPATLLCEGTIRIGWVDARNLRPQRIPAQVLVALQGSA